VFKLVPVGLGEKHLDKVPCCHKNLDSREYNQDVGTKVVKMTVFQELALTF